MDETKTQFMKLYAGLPLGLRNDIVVVLDENGPVTWFAAYVEVENNTKKGDVILSKLQEMGIL